MEEMIVIVVPGDKSGKIVDCVWSVISVELKNYLALIFC